MSAENLRRRKLTEQVRMEIIREYQRGLGPAIGAWSPDQIQARVNELIDRLDDPSDDELFDLVTPEAEVKEEPVEEIKEEPVEEIEEEPVEEPKFPDLSDDHPENTEEAPAPAEPEKEKLTAKETVALIEEAQSADEVAELSADDNRKTVQEAAEKRLEELSSDDEEE